MNRETHCQKNPRHKDIKVFLTLLDRYGILRVKITFYALLKRSDIFRYTVDITNTADYGVWALEYFRLLSRRRTGRKCPKSLSNSVQVEICCLINVE